MTPKVSGAAPAVALVGLTLIETYGLFRLVPRVTAGEQLTTQETAGLVISGMPVLCAILGLIHNRRLSRAIGRVRNKPRTHRATVDMCSGATVLAWRSRVVGRSGH